MEKSVISLDQFDAKSILSLFKEVGRIKKTPFKKLQNILKAKVVGLLFFEPSSRTFSSHCLAAKKLGAITIEFQNMMTTSSTVKGETLEDTIKVFNNYCDLIIMRHPQMGAAKRAFDVSSVPIINAGDGAGEHPTQALMDLYTIFEHHKKLDHLTGLFSGDILYGRTVHSIIRGLSYFPGNTLYLLSPRQLRLSTEDKSIFAKRKIKLIEIETEKEIPANCHFWYWTRVQKERFKSLADYEKVKNRFILTEKLVKAKAGKKTLLMHPLPRVGEVEIKVDEDKRAVYFSGLKNGVYVRMALLKLILTK